MRGRGKHLAVAAALVAVVALIWSGVPLIWSGADRVEPGEAQAGPALRIEVRRAGPAESEAEREAAQRALAAARTPGHLAVAIGSVVPPATSDEAVHQLSLLLNLICNGGTPRAEALVILQDRGLDAATAAEVVEAAGRVQPCPAAGG